MNTTLESYDILRAAGLDPDSLGYERTALFDSGFVGFASFAKLAAASPAPAKSGVYVVLYDSGTLIEFVHPSPAGWYKKKDPSSPDTKLRANWLPGAPVVYIGKATSLRDRLYQFAKFGAGVAIGHSGGKLIWQLPNPETLMVAWKVIPQHDPEAVEAALLRHFFRRFGKTPFANDPDKEGKLKRSRHCLD